MTAQLDLLGSQAAAPLEAHARRTDPETSREAARFAAVALSNRVVLEAFRRVGPMTLEQVVATVQAGGEGVKLSDSRIRTAVAELVMVGKVRDTGATVPTRRGRKARLMEAVR